MKKKKDTYTLYVHVTPARKIYIGITKNTPSQRWSKGEGYKHQKNFYNDIKKYGWDNIEHHIVAEGLSEELAFTAEIEVINDIKLDNEDISYNIAPGGRIPWNKGKTGVYSEETLKKMRIAGTGRPSAVKGTHLSEEHKRKISEANKGSTKSTHPRAVKCLNNNKVYNSIKEASIDLNVSATAISGVCRGRRKTVGGYHFIYKDTNFMEV